jgi:hypothetical protein
MSAQCTAQLYSELKAYRLQQSRAKSQPAFCIISNKVLDAIVSECPQTVGSLLAIKGMGPTKVEQYGSGILNICCMQYGGGGKTGYGIGGSGGGSVSKRASTISPPMSWSAAEDVTVWHLLGHFSRCPGGGILGPNLSSSARARILEPIRTLALQFNRSEGAICARIKHLHNPEHKAYQRLQNRSSSSSSSSAVGLAVLHYAPVDADVVEVVEVVDGVARRLEEAAAKGSIIDLGSDDEASSSSSSSTTATSNSRIPTDPAFSPPPKHVLTHGQRARIAANKATAIARRASAGSSSPANVQLPVGTAVVIKGLLNERWNGKCGSVVGFSQGGRYVVRVEGGRYVVRAQTLELQLKPENVLATASISTPATKRQKTRETA